jgi:hypothetical protein
MDPSLQNLEMPLPGGNSEKARLEALKQERARTFVPQPGAEGVVDLRTAGAADPVLGRNFIGNSYNFRVPCDNDMAISDSGYIVSVINSTAFFMDDGGTILDFISLDDMFLPLGLSTSDAFDPKVLYDPEQRKFVLVCLNGFTPTTSDILVAFSETENPTGAWNLYSLPGNPLSDTSWTDYPIISMTEKEVFITVNLLWPDSSWQTGFKQSVIWQIDKEQGYLGDSLTPGLWTDVEYGGKPVRNLCPVRGGGGSKGPNMYFLSNRNFAPSSDTIFVVEINDTLNAPGVALTVDMKHSSTNYGVPPNARQKFGLQLQTNDARILGAFLEDNQVQFVGNTLNPATGFCAVYHGTIDDIAGTRTVSGNIIGDTIVDIGYANLSWTGSAPGEHDAIISFDYTGPDTFAGVACVYSDGLGGYSPRMIVKKGSSVLNIIAGTLERWGDYSGSQRDYDNPGVIWMAGMYGRTSTTQGTWLAEIGKPGFVGTAKPQASATEAVAYPNPASERVFVEFTLPKGQMLQIGLVDAQGKLVRSFFNDWAKTGLNQFSFDTQSLPSGIYFLNIVSQQGTIAAQKIVKQ